MIFLSLAPMFPLVLLSNFRSCHFRTDGQTSLLSAGHRQLRGPAEGEEERNREGEEEIYSAKVELEQDRYHLEV